MGEKLKVIIDSAERRGFALNVIKNIRAADCPLLCTIEPHIEKKTDEQRAFFHVLVREMSKETGYLEAEIKELIKKEILGTKIVEIGGVSQEVTSSSETDDSGLPRCKPSYAELIEGAYSIAADAGIQLPGPR